MAFEGSFLETTDPDISESIPTHISGRTSNPIYISRGVLADIAIAEIPFRLAISDNNPYKRETADFRRQQIDTSAEPGEQTLAQWWVRDQESWHRGAGINFYEPGSNEGATKYRFNSSVNLDVWTEGQATLVHSTPLATSATGGQSVYCTPAKVSGVDVSFIVVGSTLSRHNGTTKTDYTGSAGSEPVIAGSKVLTGTTAGILAGDTTGTTLTSLWSSTGAAVRPWWVKSRIIASKANVLYDLTLAGGTIDGSTPKLYEHPDANWTWTSVAEAPGAILASGYSNGYGFIYRFSLTDPGAGASPVVGGASQVADFPPGEEVHSIKNYLSTYLAIGTTRGVRVGIMDTDGSVQYGPLIIETTNPVRCFAARDRFIYVGIQDGIDGMSGCARIDLSQSTADLRFAYAFDANAQTTGQVQSIGFLGQTERVTLGVLSKGFYLQSASLYEATGYVLSGRIRFGTVEPKAYNRAKVRAAIPEGTGVTLTTVNAQGSQESIVRMGGAWNTDEDITLKSIADIGQPHAQILLTLDSSDDGTLTPTLNSFQVKATPLPRIQRLIQYPLLCQDIEEDRNGNKTGKLGSASERLAALEGLEQGRSEILVQDFRRNESFSAQVRTVQFINDTPPSRNKPNFGGLVLVTVLAL
jgi:hypothetical protein